MSTFQELLDKQVQLEEQQKLRVETIRRIESITGRPLVVYVADWLTPVKQATPGFSAFVGLDHNDILPFRDLTSPFGGPQIDILIHSPGGLGEAAERLVNLLRGQFKEVRFIVPHSALSAATMLCFSGDTIVMNDVSALGPIDPQVNGVPARAIKKGFERVRKGIGKNTGRPSPVSPDAPKVRLACF